jgi:hypothetical protein
MITVYLSLYLLGQTTLAKAKIERNKRFRMNSSTGTRSLLKQRFLLAVFSPDTPKAQGIEGVSSTDLDPNPQLDVDSIVSQDQGVPQEKKKVRKFLVLKCWMFFYEAFKVENFIMGTIFEFLHS